MHNRAAAGFTLIEIMIVVAIVAILATIALPAYNDQIRKSRRSEAVSAMQDAQLKLEKWRVDHADFTGSGTTIADTKYYKFTITATAATPNNYSIAATAQGDQAKDYCKDLGISVAAGVVTKTPSSARCW